MPEGGGVGSRFEELYAPWFEAKDRMDKLRVFLMLEGRIFMLNFVPAYTERTRSWVYREWDSPVQIVEHLVVRREFKTLKALERWVYQRASS